MCITKSLTIVCVYVIEATHSRLHLEVPAKLHLHVYIHSVSFRKIYKGGQNDTQRKFGGAKGLCAAGHPLGGSGGMPPQEIFDF